MNDPTGVVGPFASGEPVPPPRRRHRLRPLGIHAVQLIGMLSLLPIAASVVALAHLSSRRLPAHARQRGRPRTYSDASVLLIALIARLWQLSTREVCDWLGRWSALATACGLPPGQVIHPAQLSRRIRRLGPYPCWLLYLALVWGVLRCGLATGRDVVLDSTLLAAWTPQDPDAAWSYPTPRKGRIFGYKVHVLLDRLSRLPLGFLLSPANRNDLPFAYPLLWFVRFVLGLPIHIVRADGAYWGLGLVRFIVTVIGAHAIIPFNRKKQPLSRVRQLAYWPVSYLARAIIERFFGIAKCHYRLGTAYTVGWEPVLTQVCLTFSAILVVALAAHQAGAPELRLSPTRVLAHYQPVEATL